MANGSNNAIFKRFFYINKSINKEETKQKKQKNTSEPPSNTQEINTNIIWPKIQWMQFKKTVWTAYHDCRESRDWAQAGQASGIAGIQHVGDHAAHTGCHEGGVQGMTTGKHKGRGVQQTCTRRKSSEKSNTKSGLAHTQDTMCSLGTRWVK